jgi:putative two-component system response regulator
MINEEKILKAKVLIVDDQELSTRLLIGIFRKAGYNNLTTTQDPRNAFKLYKEINPDLLVLDLNMPHLDGFQVMEQLKTLENESYLPILVITGEEKLETRFQALKSGAKDFLYKPYDPVEVLLRVRNLIEVRMLHNEIRDQNKILEEKVHERTQQLYDAQLDVIQRLARAVEYRDQETGFHIVRMSRYCECLSKKMGLSPKECELVLMASPLHDIGKIGIPDSILQKPGKLTPEEWETMKRHTIIGYELLSGSSSEFLEVGRTIALTHHEKWDGTGYPKGLKGEEIPLIGHICGLCDVFDALMTERPYKRAWTMKETVAEIEKGRSKHFNPKLVDSFLDVLPEIKDIQEKYKDQENHKNGQSN